MINALNNSAQSYLYSRLSANTNTGSQPNDAADSQQVRSDRSRRATRPLGANRVGARQIISPYAQELKARSLQPQGSEQADLKAIVDYDRENQLDTPFARMALSNAPAISQRIRSQYGNANPLANPLLQSANWVSQIQFSGLK